MHVHISHSQTNVGKSETLFTLTPLYLYQYFSGLFTLKNQGDGLEYTQISLDAET